MILALREVAGDDATVTLAASLPPASGTQRLRYLTRAGALLRLDGVAAGAFDREHDVALVEGSDRARDLTLEVERRSLPTNGLPAGPGFSWWLMNLLAAPEPARSIAVEAAQGENNETVASDGIVLWGHSHLDVAWLWTYAQTRRKAQRTFAIALDLLERDRQFAFMQSQPQLYRFVQDEDPELFARVRDHARTGRFDPDVAALWVEPDCNLPSGESLIRQMLFAHVYCTREFAVEPSIAWLPDSFGFANTLPSLLAHCGITRFATTKLQWNDTTRFPYPQFIWRGPDGAEVLSALIASYDGGVSDGRLQTARERREPLVAGYGDGGGGVTFEMLAQARNAGTWQRPRAWFDALEARGSALPVHGDELYLQYHRGVYTTHHDLKAANASLERRLAEVEEQLAWCVAVRAPKSSLDELRSRVRSVWETLLRNQFHDVLPGTSILEVNADAREEYASASELLERTATSVTAMLPRAPHLRRSATLAAPRFDEDAYVFDNGVITARVRGDGTLTACTRAGERNAVAQANLLALYRDRPQKWEAWNVDAGYERTRRPARPGAARIEDDGLEIPLDLGDSRATMRVTLGADDAFLRVDLAVDWSERRTLLRVENWLAVASDCAQFGTPHGTIVRSARNETPEERAAFEVPGQRFALARDESGNGMAMLALDTYGWSARVLPQGGMQLGHSLLRGTTWPDPQADIGAHRLSWAYMPIFRDITTGTIEAAWQRFAHEARVRLFLSDDASVLVVGCKPAEDGDGAIVRVRECDGVARELRLRCGGRMREAIAVDGLERPTGAGDVRIDAEALVAPLPAFALRSFRVRF